MANILALYGLKASTILLFLVPTVLLNPVLFLHGLNAVLAIIFPPTLDSNTSYESPSYYPKGPPAENPHINIHASDGLCWGYTIMMVGAQIMAFARLQAAQREHNEEMLGEYEEMEAAEDTGLQSRKMTKPTLESASIWTKETLLWSTSKLRDVRAEHIIDGLRGTQHRAHSVSENFFD